MLHERSLADAALQLDKVIKLSFPASSRGAITSNHDLTNDEENALRYAAGFTLRLVRRKIDKASPPVQSCNASDFE